MLEYETGGSPVQRQNKIVSFDSANKSQLRSGCRTGSRLSHTIFGTGRLQTGQIGMATEAIVPTAGQQRNARIPKSNRMPDAPHSVKVETQVVDSIEDLGQNFVRRINVPQVSARIALAHTA